MPQRVHLKAHIALELQPPHHQLGHTRPRPLQSNALHQAVGQLTLLVSKTLMEPDTLYIKSMEIIWEEGVRVVTVMTRTLRR